MSSPIFPIHIDNLSIIRGERRLLDSISCRIESQGITVVMGPNGAGKSLLIRCMHGLVELDAGDMSFGAAPLDDAVRLRQSMVFQAPTLMRRTVLANLLFVAQLRQIDDRRHVHEILEKVGLSHLANQSARLLSGGEKQRLALARALLTRPDMLLLDEATSNLDPASTKIIEDIIHAVSAAGTIVIVVTHDIGQAKRLAQEVIFLHQGRLCEHSPASGFFKSPASAEAGAYLAGELVF